MSPRTPLVAAVPPPAAKPVAVPTPGAAPINVNGPTQDEIGVRTDELFLPEVSVDGHDRESRAGTRSGFCRSMRMRWARSGR
jgi:hypothetical protein